MMTDTASLRPDAAMPEIGRPREIESLSNRYFIHRASAILLPAAIRIGVHPNVVSLAGLSFGLLAAAAYAQWRAPWMATLGLLAMLAWHICDGLDGQLARATGKTSAFGRYLDGACDYSTFIFVYIILAATRAEDIGPVTSFGLAALAGAAHIVQAIYYEGERESYTRRLRGLFEARPLRVPHSVFEKGYDRLQRRLSDRERPVDAWLRQHDPATRLERYRERAAPILRTMAILSANGRTFAIWLTCLADMPELFWLWELIGLSIIALWLCRRLRTAEEQVAR